MLFICGPGHGAPAPLACLWLEDSLGHFYADYSRDRQGLTKLITKFSTPSGFPSHINAQVPGSIHEGGELGYALSVAYGAVMDKPDLIACCMVGDGEAETGPTATAWHACKYIDPKESGAVIPILHVNGFKISERTIFGCMDNRELAVLFSGYGYIPTFVEYPDCIDAHMAGAIEWAVQEIRKIQQAARSGKPIVKPRWPMIILRTPKGFGGPKKVHGEFVEGSFRAHQVPLTNVKTDTAELQLLERWLSSYAPDELFTDGKPNEEVLRIVPENPSKRLGQNPIAYDSHQPLVLGDWKRFALREGTNASCTATAGEFLDQVLVNNPHKLRIFSPDEMISNKFDAVFRHTGRNFQWDQFSMNKGGQVTEILSEHTCQGFLQGYTLTGRTGILPSYESFLGIVHTMMVQYAKFAKISKETPWRKDVSSINYIETSTWTRQEHNGLSHQNPSFIGAVLNLKPSIARIYLPPDPNTFLSTLHHCLKSKNYVNLIVGSKHPQPVWLTPEEAAKHCKAGTSIWKFASTDSGLNPDVVLVGIGSELMFEVIAAAAYLRQILPSLKVRVVNVTDLMVLGSPNEESAHPHALTTTAFDTIFTPDKHIHFNYHGYASEIQGLLFGRPKLDRVSVTAYMEEGSTTTPFDMLMRNRCDRFHVAMAAVNAAAKHNWSLRHHKDQILEKIRKDIRDTQDLILEKGADPEALYKKPVFEDQQKEEKKEEKAALGISGEPYSSWYYYENLAFPHLPFSF